MLKKCTHYCNNNIYLFCYQMGTHNTFKHFPRYNFGTNSKWLSKQVQTFKRANPTTQRTNGITTKPDGKWYSLYAAWSNWGEVSKGKHIHRITFVPKVHISWQESRASGTLSCVQKIVVLRSFEDLQQFNQQYGVVMHKKYVFIRWKEVAKDYGGIEFIHYKSITKHILNNELAYAYIWYLSIEASSGCVWNNALVKDIEYAFDVDV